MKKYLSILKHQEHILYKQYSTLTLSHFYYILHPLIQRVLYMISADKILRSTAKGRTTLEKTADGMSEFMAFYDEVHRVVLKVNAEIPAKEKWIFNNSAVLNKVKSGLSDAAAGFTKQREPFSQYIGENN